MSRDLKDKIKSKEIDGDVYEVTPFLGIEGFKIKTKLMALLGAPIGGALAGIPPGAKGVADCELSKIISPDVIDRLLSVLDEEELISFVLRILSSTRCNNSEIDKDEFNMHFAASFHTLYKVIYFVLEVNYGSFFGEDGLGTLLITAMTPSSGPSTKKRKNS